MAEESSLGSELNPIGAQRSFDRFVELAPRFGCRVAESETSADAAKWRTRFERHTHTPAEKNG